MIDRDKVIIKMDLFICNKNCGGKIIANECNERNTDLFYDNLLYRLRCKKM